jgi:hypothetical protein
MKGKKTGGRQKGAKNKRTLALETAMKEAALGLPTGTTALSLHQSVYRNETLGLDLRLQAAAQAMPYESPRLAAVQHTGANGGPIQTTHIDLDKLPLDDARTVLRILSRAQNG